MRASVVLCTYNPDPARLQRVLDALDAQSLPKSEWDIILVDNASKTSVASLGLRVPSNTTIIEEPKPGLLYARQAGIEHSTGATIVFCDDDNVLAAEYLAAACNFLDTDKNIGVISGRSRPEFQTPPPVWAREFFGCLALYDHGEQVRRAKGISSGYPAFIGGGCGAVFRRKALADAMQALRLRAHAITGRRGDDLTSGEDNDIVLMILRQGWEAAYLPDLVLTHLIPGGRLTLDYFAQLNEAIARSWVKVLHQYGLSPWPPTSRIWLPLQIGRAYLRFRAWSGPAAYIRWRGACGTFKGRADLHERAAAAQPLEEDCVQTGGGAP